LAEIVEFCGAPGTGKTTIYLQLVSRWKKTDGWIPGHKLYPRVGLQYKTVSGFLKTTVARAKNDVDFARMNAAVPRFVRQHEEFTDSFWKNIVYRQKQHFDGVDNRFRATEIWFKIIRKIQTIIEYKCNKLAVIDEGLIQRIDSALHKSIVPEEQMAEIAWLLEKMPLPRAVIYFYADIDVVIARMKLRKKRMPFFDDLSSSDLRQIYQDYKKRWLSTFALLEQKGVSLLIVDATREAKENVAVILHFLQAMSLNR
jgi:shikimate kinase